GSAAQCAPHETRQCLRSPAASPPTRERTLPPTCLSFRCLEAAFDTQAWWTWLLSYLFAFALRSRASCSARSYPRLSSLSTSTTWLSLLPNGRESPINLSRGNRRPSLLHSPTINIATSVFARSARFGAMRTSPLS